MVPSRSAERCSSAHISRAGERPARRRSVARPRLARRCPPRCRRPRRRPCRCPASPPPPPMRAYRRTQRPQRRPRPGNPLCPPAGREPTVTPPPTSSATGTRCGRSPDSRLASAALPPRSPPAGGQSGTPTDPRSEPTPTSCRPARCSSFRALPRSRTTAKRCSAPVRRRMPALRTTSLRAEWARVSNNSASTDPPSKSPGTASQPNVTSSSSCT